MVLIKNINDLRSFLEVLRENNQLVNVEKEVSINNDIGNVLATLEKENREAAYFPEVKNSYISNTYLTDYLQFQDLYFPTNL